MQKDATHQAPSHLHSTKATWPFEEWEMDIIGPINSPSSKGHQFILAIINYFSKWVELIPLKEVIASNIINFVKHYVIYIFGIRRRIGHDNGPQFVCQTFQKFCRNFRIQIVSSTAYYPVAKLSGGFYKKIGKLLKKFVSGANTTGTTDLANVYGHTAPRSELRQRPPTFSLVYGCKAVLPLEI